MAGIRLNGRAYGGVATVANADHLMCEDGSGNVINAQTLLNRILGDFATVETSSTASKAYAIGDYLVFNGQLYKVTTAISQGGTLTVGTNITVTNVGAEVTALNSNSLKWRYINSGSYNDIKSPGLYYCDSGCTDRPSETYASVFVLEVIPSGLTGTQTIKQIATAVTSEERYERYMLESTGTWTEWQDISRAIPISGDLSTMKYYRKRGGKNYGCFIILATFGGIGSTAILCSLNNGAIDNKINLLTGEPYTNANLTITYSVVNNIGTIGLKTASNGASVGCIFC